MNALKIKIPVPIPEGFIFESFDESSVEITLAPIPQEITDRVKTFEDACNVLGIPVPTFVSDDSKDGKSIIAYQKLIIIARALNEGWEPNWGNWDENKYYPYFQFAKGSTAETGFGFSYDAWTYSGTATIVGSRLCFKSKPLAIYAGQQFESIYKDYLTL